MIASRKKKPIFSVVIPAAGESSRFGRQNKRFVSKLLLGLSGKPVLERSLAVFRSLPEVREIVVAAHPKLARVLRRDKAVEWAGKKPVKIILGGRTRGESVWLGLRRTSKKTSHVIIHDGARPLVRPEWVAGAISALNGADGVVLGRSVIPTMKRVKRDGEILETVNREELFEAETPQVFKKDVLLDAYKRLGPAAFGLSDDAALVELAGGTVKAFLHQGTNLKITTPGDLELAERMISGGGQMRFGLGFDTHRLVNGRIFFLGGIRLKAPFGPLGHSDGDPLLHAVIDGMLGAAGLGDIGDLFSDRNPKWKNISSFVLAEKTHKLLNENGLRVFQIDATVFLEKPKLGDSKRKIALHLAKLFSLPPARVSVKAKTAEGLGPEGRSEAVSAQALVVLAPNGLHRE